MKHAKSISLGQLNGHLIILNKRKLIKLSALFAFRCQKCSIRKLHVKLYGGVEYKILHHQFFEGNIFFNKKVERSEIVGLKIFRSNSQVSIMLITYFLLKCLPNKTMQLILYG